MSRNFITMENPVNGMIRQVKIGPAWDCQFAALLLFVPFFYRRIYKWAIIDLLVFIAIATIISFSMAFTSTLPLTEEQKDMITNYVLLGTCIFNIFFLLKGNELTAKNYYKKGFYVTDTDEALIKNAKAKLKLPNDAFLTKI